MRSPSWCSPVVVGAASTTTTTTLVLVLLLLIPELCSSARTEPPGSRVKQLLQQHGRSPIIDDGAGVLSAKPWWSKSTSDGTGNGAHRGGDDDLAPRPSASSSSSESPSPRPLIGILSQPKYWKGMEEAAGGYIAASYVKYVEAAGARAVPIRFDAAVNNETGLARLLASLNGVMLPGGDSDISPGTPLRATAEAIVRASIDAHSRGNADEKSSEVVEEEGIRWLRTATETKKKKRKKKAGAGLVAVADGAGGGVVEGEDGEGEDGELGSDVKKTKNGGGDDHFPVWGTCMGFQLMTLAVSGDESLLGTFDGADYASGLVLTPSSSTSRLLNSLPPKVLAVATAPGATHVYENHVRGFHPAAFTTDANLNEVFRAPVALDVDKKGVPYVAAIEGVGGLPLFGVQFHPEKTMAEWDPELAIPHDGESVLLSQSLANFFVGEARRSRRSPAMGGYTEDELVMANYRTTFVGKGGYRGTHFDEIYILE